MKDKFILDACCGPRYFWTNKQHPNALYIDIEPREGVNPDLVADFRDLSRFKDKSFKLIVWDPPHLKTLGKTSIFRQKYGCLNAETWPSDLKKGFNELWRVLEDYGVLIFKFADNEIKFQKVLKLFHTQPLFYQISSFKATSKTAWFTFMKIPEDQEC